MQRLDKVTKFLFRHGSQVMLMALSLYGLIEYLDFNKGFDYVLALVLITLLSKEAFNKE